LQWRAAGQVVQADEWTESAAAWTGAEGAYEGRGAWHEHEA